MAQHHSTANDQAFEEADAIQGANYKTVSLSTVSLTHQQRTVTGAWDRTQTFDILIFPQISYLVTNFTLKSWQNCGFSRQLKIFSVANYR